VAQLRSRFSGYTKGRPGLSLLVRFDRDVPTQTLVEITEAATAAGFAPVTLAAETAVPATVPGSP
jgi:biopolymer transport protein ExbD